MKPWQLLMIGVLFGLLAAGMILLVSSPIKGHPITLSSPPAPTRTATLKPTTTSTPIQVQIGGEVFNPGIYALENDARLGDLIAIAGGLKPSADHPRINLAAICRDGEYFYIPAVDEIIPETARNAPQNLNLGTTPEFTYPLDLNQASKEELESLPGIGPGKAEEIIKYRTTFGPFKVIEDLMEVEGIGQKTFESLKEFLIIEP